MATAASLRDSVRQALQSHVDLHRDQHAAIDILRAFQKEAELLHVTEFVKDQLVSDPFQHLESIRRSGDLERLVHRVQVTDYHRVMTKEGYAAIEAVVCIPAAQVDQEYNNKVQKKKGGMPTSHIELTFRYERDAAVGTNYLEGMMTIPTTVFYSIEISQDNGPNQRILWVHVMAAGSTPSRLPAKNMDDDDDDEWEDMEDDDEEGNGDTEEDEQELKRPKLFSNKADKECGSNQPQDEECSHEECDRFVAGIDPEALALFLKLAHLGPMDDATAFFLLMTFPFYEHEWDLLGYLLEAVFGYDDDNDDDDMETSNGKKRTASR